jgi:hypothetical protein
LAGVVWAACPAINPDCNLNGLADSLDPDCNSNGTPDACESLTDCNTNGLPDVCEPPQTRSRLEYLGVLECLQGPAAGAAGTSSSGCSCSFFDLDSDGDVDLLDYAALQQAAPNTVTRWWNPLWSYRLPLTIGAAGYARTDHPATVSLNFTAALASLGAPGPFAASSLRVVEVDGAGIPIDERVMFQFDPDPGFNAATNAVGTLTLNLSGTTAAAAERHYEVYFAPASAGLPAACFEPLVSVIDNVSHEGQLSFRINTAIGSWYYQKQGAGFASLDDVNGKDWIAYHPGGGSAGEYRGIPNSGTFHPGYTLSTSTLESNGPVRARIRSQTTDGLWECTWDIYPRVATMTMLRVGGTYWFLYEGTPNGTLNTTRQFVVRSNGVQTPLTQDWSGDMPAPEWLYFGDSITTRFLFVAHHGDDAASDQFWQMEGNMTVFGFGRQYPCCDKYLTAVPNRFTVGLAEAANFATAAPLVEAAWRDLAVTVGAAEER